MDKIGNEEILKEYEGQFYENVGGFPIEDMGDKVEEKAEELGLPIGIPEDVQDSDIQKIFRSGLNSREAHYLAVKLGFYKRDLIRLEKLFQQEKKVWKNAWMHTNTEERDKIGTGREWDFPTIEQD